MGPRAPVMHDAGPLMRRRSLLAAPLLFGAAACGQRAEPAWDGGWIGAAHERGHLLRAAGAGASDNAPGHATAQGSSKVTAPASVRRCSVAVLGGGVAGLAAARALLRAGIDDLRLFELEDSAGGNARGHVMGGLACPLGAHYLPLPGPQAHAVSELLHDLGLLRHELGRTVADERQLCHSPQERMWIDGQWTEGLLPPAEPGSARERDYRRFAALVHEASQALGFSIPTRRSAWSPGHAALDAVTFAQWLDTQGLHDRGLRWYLDYACRDDYGAGSATVSAWAGLHYFASRHGFHVPGDEGGEREPVFTWPEGNAWLTRRLAAPLGDRLLTGRLVQRVSAGRHGVQVDLWHAATGRTERWLADQAVMALPLPVAARVLVEPPAALRTAATLVQHAPWLVANLQLRAPLTDKPGASPSWDNVLANIDAAGGRDVISPALGYVDAMHQSLRPLPGPTVLTAYWALGDGDAAAVRRQRQALLDQPWQAWAERVIADLARAHPDLPAKVQRANLMRYGHAMAMPTPGVRGSLALQALAQPQAGRLQFAHADLSGHSVFEEAYTLGEAAGRVVAGRLRR